jgi:hypothetical protein
MRRFFAPPSRSGFSLQGRFSSATARAGRPVSCVYLRLLPLPRSTIRCVKTSFPRQDDLDFQPFPPLSNDIYNTLFSHDYIMILFRSLFLLALASGIRAQLNFPTSDCVDPAGTAACIQQEDAVQVVACNQTCSGVEGELHLACLEGCACVSYSNYMNCIVSGCWNKVRPRLKLVMPPSDLSRSTRASTRRCWSKPASCAPARTRHRSPTSTTASTPPAPAPARAP